MRILQLSDLHLANNGEYAFRHADSVMTLKQTIDYILTAPIYPDVVVVTGDVSTDGSASSYEFAMEQLKRLPWPLYMVPGNHDEREPMLKVCGDVCRLDPELYPESQNCVDLPEARLLFVDSVIEFQPHGRITDATAKWVKEHLPEDPNRPTLIFLHHVPFKTWLPAMDEPVENVDALLDVLSGHENVLVCCGHIHTSIMTYIKGVKVMTAPPVSMQMEIDLRPGGEAPRPGGDAFFTAEPAFALHLIENGQVVTHFCTVPTGDRREGPYYF